MKLEKIIKYYEKQHKIKIGFEIVDDFCLSRCYPDRTDKNISDILISKEHIEKVDFKNRFIYKNLEEKIILTLLHEIGHSLQYQKSSGYDEYKHTYNIQSRLEHSNRPFEIEADRFARQELKKWKK